MWPRLLFWTASFVLLLAGGPKALANVWARAVDRQLDEMAAAVMSEGWVEVGRRQGGSLAAREVESLWLAVPGSSEWMVIGACDQDCSDLDLRAFAGPESVLAEDTEADDVPMLGFSGGIEERQLEIEVGMVECSNDPCFWGVAVMVVAPASPVRGGGEVEAAEGPSRRFAGVLRPGDETLATGELYEEHSFQGTAGEEITLDLRSGKFEPYLMLASPSGEIWHGEDSEPSGGFVRLRATLDQSGTWVVAVTTAEPGQQGPYKLEIRHDGGGDRPPMTGTVGSGPNRSAGEPPAPAADAPRIWAVLVGISDYAGEENDLAYTADDARRMQQALVQGAGMRLEDSLLMVDGDATVGAFRSAFERLAGRIGSDDTFVVFFSGHGGRVAREQLQASDPDALDETLSFVDGELTDDELATLLDQIRAGRTLVVLDSCFSGGFAKDLISVPGRMGLFSSEEDVVSQVAAKFRAGGFLAAFLAEGIGDGYADDGDGKLTALELSQYVYERYRTDVKSKGAGRNEVVDTSDRLGYQHLVVDRGSIPPSEALFRVDR